MSDTVNLTIPAAKLAVVQRIIEAHYDKSQQKCIAALNQFEKTNDASWMEISQYHKDEMIVFFKLLEQTIKA